VDDGGGGVLHPSLSTTIAGIQYLFSIFFLFTGVADPKLFFVSGSGFYSVGHYVSGYYLEGHYGFGSLQVISDPDPDPDRYRVPVPLKSNVLCRIWCLYHCIFIPRGLILNDNFVSRSGSYWSGLRNRIRILLVRLLRIRILIGKNFVSERIRSRNTAFRHLHGRLGLFFTALVLLSMIQF